MLGRDKERESYAHEREGEVEYDFRERERELGDEIRIISHFLLYIFSSKFIYFCTFPLHYLRIILVLHHLFSCITTFFH